nr:DUF6049 family protein [Actinopolymorpha pittospori]
MAGRAKFVAAVVAVLACVGGLLTATTKPAAAQTPRVQVQLDSLTPYATNSTKTLRITGRVTNTGDIPLSTVNAMLWFDGTPLTNRDQLNAAAAETPGERLGTRLDEPWSLVDEVAPTLRPRATAKFTLNVPMSRIGLHAAGVYVVGVDIRATSPDSQMRETWRARSFLPYVPSGTKMTPVEVAFVLPVVDRPRLVEGDVLQGATGVNDAGETPSLSEFAPNGRLSELIDLGAKHDLSFAVDPALLDEARRMSDGFTTSAGTRINSAATTDVRNWLSRARGVLGAGDTLMLPYADPDLPALQRYRLSDRFTQAVQAADQTSDQFHAAGTLAWPGSGYADAGTLETIAASKARTVLLSQNALPGLPKDGSSPVASLATPEGAVTALVSDPTLTAGGPAGQTSPASIQQRFLSETALLAMQQNPASDPPTSDLRRVVATLPRTWDPGPSGETLFNTVESTSWLRSLSVGALLSQAPTAYGGPLRPSTADRKAELDPDVVDHLRQLSATSTTLLDMLAEPERSRPGLDRGFLRGASTAWRQNPTEAIALIDTMDERVQQAITRVEVVPPRLVTLSSQSGRFPVTIWNRGTEPALVRLEVRPSDPSALKIAPIEPIRVDRNRKATVSVTAETSTGGAVQMEARLTTRSGTAFGPTQSFPVRVTGYGQVGWVVIWIGLGLILLAASTRIFKRVRGAMSGQNADTETGTETARPADPKAPAGSGGAPARASRDGPDPEPTSEATTEPTTEPRAEGTAEPKAASNGHVTTPEESGTSEESGEPGGHDTPPGPPDHDMTKAKR